MSQLQKQCEEIPEVPEEASSANITPRRMEEENEELARANEEYRNQSPLFGIVQKLNKIKEMEKPLKEKKQNNAFGIAKFNIDREVEIPRDAEMDLSILSSLDSSQNEDVSLNSNELDASNISFNSGNFQNINTSSKKPPNIPMLNLSKIKSPHATVGMNFSLNLSAISGNQSGVETSLVNGVNFSAQNFDKKGGPSKYIHKRNDSTKSHLKRAKKVKFDSKIENSFINDVNMITECIAPQHNHKISNLDLTFEKSDSKDNSEDFWPKEKLSSGKKFKKTHWNFGSKRLRAARVQKIKF
jgi:hypothetical protein